MPYRIVGHAQDRIEAALLDSARRWGLAAATRYSLLIIAAMTAVAEAPGRPGSRDVPRVPGLRTFHLHLARGLVARADRVREPRHLLVYRVAPDGVVEILSLVHDRMRLTQAARGARRAADTTDMDEGSG